MAIFFFQNEAKIIPSQDFMVMNISCKCEKSSYSPFFVRALTVKSLYTLWRWRNKAKSLVSTGGYNDYHLRLNFSHLNKNRKKQQHNF